MMHGYELRGSDVICLLWKTDLEFFSLNSARVRALGWPLLGIFSGFFSFLRWGLWDESVIGNIQYFGAQIFLAVWPHWSITHSCSSTTHCVEHWPCWDVRQVSFSDTALSRCLGVLFPALSPDRSQAYPTATSLGCVCVMIFKRKCFTLLKDFLWRSPPCTGRREGNNFDFFCSWVRGGADSCVPWALLSCKTTGLIFFLLSLIRTHSSRWLFCRYGACGICLCFHNPPNSYMDYRIVNVRMWSFLTRTRDLGLWSHLHFCELILNIQHPVNRKGHNSAKTLVQSLIHFILNVALCLTRGLESIYK